MKSSATPKPSRFKLVSLSLASIILVSCTSNPTAKLISVEHEENIVANKYRSIGTIEVEVLDKTFTNGLAHLKFKFDADVENQIIDKKMAFLFADVSSCESKVVVYSEAAFRNIENTDSNIYSVFLPHDFEKEVLENNNRSYDKFNASDRVSFYGEGGCIELKAGSMAGRKLQSNSIKIFRFEGDENSLSWEKGPD